MTTKEQGSGFSITIIQFERTIYLIAALSAIFGVFVYFSEAEDRSLDSRIKRAQLLATCIELVGPNAPMSELKHAPPKNDGDPNYSATLSKETIEKFKSSCEEIDMYETRHFESAV